MVDTGLDLPDDLSVSPEQLRASIADAVKQIVPDGKSGAALAVIDTDGSAHFLIAQKIGADWEVQGELSHRNGEAVSGSVKIAGSW